MDLRGDFLYPFGSKLFVGLLVIRLAQWYSTISWCRHGWIEWLYCRWNLRCQVGQKVGGLWQSESETTEKPGKFSITNPNRELDPL